MRKKIKVLLCGSEARMDPISEALGESDIESEKCRPNPLDIQSRCLTDDFFAVMFEYGSFDYRELAENLSKNSRPTQLYVLSDPFCPVPYEKSSSPNVHHIENIHSRAEIAKTLRMDALEIFRESYISRAEFCQTADDIVYKALDDLCFTANYIGTAYIRKSLTGLCMREIKRTDSMCKTVYPYIAMKFNVSSASVERSIRTAIKRCWNSSDESVRVEYFGFAFLNNRDIPTNREFMMILADKLIRDMKKLETRVRIDSMCDI